MNYQTNDEDTKNDAAAEKHNPIDESKKNLSRILSDGATDNLAEALDIANEKSPERLSAIKEIVERHADIAVKGTIQGLLEYFDTDKIKSINDAINATRRIMESSLETLKNLYPAVTAYMDRFKAASDIVEKYNQAHFAELISAELPKDQLSIYNLLPFLNISFEEFKKSNTDEKYNSFEFVDLVRLIRDGFNDQDEPVNEVPPEIKTLLDRAFDLQIEFLSSDYKSITEFYERSSRISRTVAPVDKSLYPLDKPNSYVWNMIAEIKNKNQQYQINFDTTKKNASQKGTQPDELSIVYYALWFDDENNEFKISKRLTVYDKRVYIAAHALYIGGNDIITPSLIYKCMGYRKNASQHDIEKINDSLTKLNLAHILINNSEEVAKYKNYPKFIYDGSLLPFERVSAYINDKYTDSAIHLFREPPLMTFARERKQITTIKLELLETPLSKTEGNLKLEDYLIENIGHMKYSDNFSKKMLFKTICDKCGITSPKLIRQIPDKIKEYLEHFKKCGWIKNYTMSKISVTIEP